MGQGIIGRIFAPLRREPSPAHAEVRYYAATRAESERLRSRQRDVRLQLAVYVAVTTHEQRKQAMDEYVALARETQEQRFQRAVKAGAFRGIGG